MSCRITHTQSSNIHPSPIYLTPAPWFSVVSPFLQFTTPHHVTASHPSPGDNQAKLSSRNSISKICIRALHSFPSFAHCRAASTVIPLLPKTAFTRSIQPNLGLHRTPLRLHPLSTPFWKYGAHPFFPQGQTISILSDPLCSLPPYLFQFNYVPFHS